MAVAASDVRAVQAFYPRIYLACHVQHRRRTAKGELTEAESNLLGHLDERVPIRASVLARHMGVSRPSMSATLKRLTSLGYVERTREATDARASALRLSGDGARAMQAGSVLDTARVRLMLARLSREDRQRALEGIGLLARAANEIPKKKWSER